MLQILQYHTRFIHLNLPYWTQFTRENLVSLQLVPSRVNNEDVQTQTTEEESEPESQTDTDVESAASSSVNALAWQDDPEFQAKVK